jgi:hypothetical protein
MEVANTLDYYKTAAITLLISFIVQAPDVKIQLPWVILAAEKVHTLWFIYLGFLPFIGNYISTKSKSHIFTKCLRMFL